MHNPAAGISCTLLSRSIYRVILSFAACARAAVRTDTTRGRFKPHRDEETLTILVPLTDPNAFEGGGTCFWSTERAEQRASATFAAGEEGGGDVSVPGDFVLRTPAGSSLVFAGCVTHAAVAVTSGERCILVASFSPATPADDADEDS